MTWTGEGLQAFKGSWFKSMRKPIDVWIKVAATNLDKENG